MVYINLLPIKDIKNRIKARQQLTLFGMIFVAVFIALGVFGFIQSTTISNLNTEIAKLTQEVKKYQATLQKIKKLEQDKKLIESKIKVINDLQKTKALTVHILDEIARLTPSDRLWLTSLDQQGTTVRMTGTALDNQTIAAYMETLESSEYIQKVNLASTSQTSYAGRNLKQFQITCSIVMPGEEENSETQNSDQTRNS